MCGHRPFKVALTGGIASGKSTVASEFLSLGVPVIDADKISKQVMCKGTVVFEQIVRLFSPECVLNQEDELDRRKIATFIFNDSKVRIKLEQLIHPVIFTRIEQEVKSVQTDYCIVALPLLIETNRMKMFDRILLIDLRSKLQLKRAMIRDKYPANFIKKIIAIQASRVERIKYADDIINNSADIASLKKQVVRLHDAYLNLSQTISY